MKLKPSLQAMIAAGLAAALSPAVSFASTAANTTLTNTVTVSFSNAANTAQTPVSDSVSIVVNLVASAPILSSPADIDPWTENTNTNLVYTITATANGPDSYSFSSVDTPTNMDDDATFTTPSITLGATTIVSLATVGGVTVITAPYDGVSDSSVNGIAAGDTIVLNPGQPNAELVTVASVDETTGGASNTVTITLTTLAANAHAYGSIVGEQASVTVVATTDSITAGTNGTHSVVSTATSAADNGISTTQTTATVIHVRRPALTVSKYVRNATTSGFNPVGAADATVDGVGYYVTGVTGNPSNQMEYVIVINNTAAGASQATEVVVSDPIPQFTTLVPNSVSLVPASTSALGAITAAEFVAQDETTTGDAVLLDGSTLRVYPGTGGSDNPATGGDLEAGEISIIRFRVSID